MLLFFFFFNCTGSVGHPPVVFELLGGPEQLLDVFGHLLGLHYDVLRARQGGVRLPRLPSSSSSSSLLRVPATLLLTAAARTDERHTAIQT